VDIDKTLSWISNPAGAPKPQPKVFVTVYHEDQAFGGPEEGGWWYTVSEPVDGVWTLCCGGREYVTYEGEYGPVTETWPYPDLQDHADGCPARGAAERYWHQYVEGAKDEYLASFVHGPDGVSWLDSHQDAPEPYRGEVATTGRYTVLIEEEPPQSRPRHRPHYE
jgi:hypothetical protein